MGTAKRERQKANRQQRLEEMAKQARKQQSRRRTLTWVGIVVAAVALIYLIVFLTGDDDESATPTSEPVATAPATTEPATTEPATTEPATTEPVTTGPAATGFAYGTGECAPADKPAEPVRTFAAAPQKCIDDDATYTALVQTDKGDFTITLDTANSPGTANNFVTLARYGYYDDSTCHRIISGFVVQCGRPGEDESAPGYTIPDEPVVTQYAEGVVAMANTGSPNTGGGQWFVITGANGASLPPSYTVLGTVTEGYDTTVKALEALADPNAPNGVPTLEPITITSVTINES